MANGHGTKNTNFRIGTSKMQAGGIDLAEKRWTKRSFRPEVEDKDGWIRNQCGGCRYFAALGSDYGICWNEKSSLDGNVVFEHGGCLEHSCKEIKDNE